MLELDPLAVLIRLTYAGCTLYMMAIILRWLGPWIELDLYSRRMAWLPRITDPLIQAIRNVLPRLGPMDFAPLLALLAVWIARTLAVAFLVSTNIDAL